jgi:hypothetical protein
LNRDQVAEPLGFNKIIEEIRCKCRLAPAKHLHGGQLADPAHLRDGGP